MCHLTTGSHWQKDIYKSIQQALVKSTSCMLDIYIHIYIILYYIYIYVLLLRRVCGQIRGHSLSLLPQFVAKVQGRPIETACRLTCQPVEFKKILADGYGPPIRAISTISANGCPPPIAVWLWVPMYRQNWSWCLCFY